MESGRSCPSRVAELRSLIGGTEVHLITLLGYCPGGIGFDFQADDPTWQSVKGIKTSEAESVSDHGQDCLHSTFKNWTADSFPSPVTRGTLRLDCNTQQ